MKPEELTFPVTAEAFAACQEALIGRDLTAGERECVDAWLPAINYAYAEGLENDTESFMEALEKMRELTARRADDTTICRFLKVAQWWIDHAWERGRQDAKKEAAV